MRVVVTGGSGFIGTNLIAYYKARGDEVLNLDIAAPRDKSHSENWRRIDILDRTALEAAIFEFSPNIVLHMAARTDLSGTHISDYAANTEGVSNIIFALRGLPELRLVVFASSMLVCRIGYHPKGHDDYMPSTPYGESKVDGERRVRREVGDSFRWVLVRPTSIWGPWFRSPYRDFFDAVERGWYFHPRGRRISRSYGFVLNLVYQIDFLVRSNSNIFLYKTLYLSDFDPIELKDWANSIRRGFGKKSVREIPLLFFVLAAKFGDFLGYFNIRFPMSSFRLNNMLTDYVVDNSLMREMVGHLPFDKVRAVSLTCKWINSQRFLS